MVYCEAVFDVRISFEIMKFHTKNVAEANTFNGHAFGCINVQLNNDLFYIAFYTKWQSFHPFLCFPPTPLTPLINLQSNLQFIYKSGKFLFLAQIIILWIFH